MIAFLLSLSFCHTLLFYLKVRVVGSIICLVVLEGFGSEAFFIQLKQKN